MRKVYPKTSTQECGLRAAITKHVKAQIAYSWIGYQSPEEREIIELNAKRAKKNLNDFISRVYDRITYLEKGTFKTEFE